MPLIDEHLFVIKSSTLPKGSMYVLKTDALRARFAALKIPDLRFEIIFDNKQDLRKENRDTLLSEGVIHICELTFNPLCTHSFCDEWMNLTTFPMVRARLYPVATKQWRKCGFSKNEIHALIEEQLCIVAKTAKRNSVLRIDLDLSFRENTIVSNAKCITNTQLESQIEVKITPGSISN